MVPMWDKGGSPEVARFCIDIFEFHKRLETSRGLEQRFDRYAETLAAVLSRADRAELFRLPRQRRGFC